MRRSGATLVPPFDDVAPVEIVQAAEATPPGSDLRLRVAGLDQFGSPIEFVAPVTMPEGETGEAKLEGAGITLRQEGDKVLIDDVAFDSAGQKAGLDWDQEILRVRQPADQPSKYWIYIPVLLVLAGVVLMQRRRAEMRSRASAATA